MSKILVVEDAAAEAAQIRNILEQGGFSVYTVSSSEEAELRMKQQPPALIILDVILPGQSGYELCRKIKGDPTTRAIPVVLCTTKSSEVDKTWGGMSGADAYITKPIDDVELLGAVKRLARAY
ncbi:MAG: response regulator [Cyanobacteria bacterium P01_H01_bin.121]